MSHSRLLVLIPTLCLLLGFVLFNSACGKGGGGGSSGPAPLPAGTVQFSAAAYSADEGNSGTSNVTITVTRSGGSNGALSVQYATSNGTATAGSDYTAATETLTWADGDSDNKTFTIAISGDTAVEPNETVNVALTGSPGTVVGTPATAVVTIVNDDAESANVLPTAAITAPASGATFTAPAAITITADASDSDGSVAKVEFFQGATKLGEDTTAPYSFVWTNVVAGNYALTVKATDDDGAVTTSATVNVTVNAVTAPTITLTLADPIIPESSTAGVINSTVLTVTRTGPATNPITLNLTDDSDYLTTPETVTIAAGELTATVTLTWEGNVSESSSAAVIITASGSGFADATVKLSVADVDGPNAIFAISCTVEDTVESVLQPKEGTTVRLRFHGTNWKSTTTNASGQFSFSGLVGPPTAYSVVVESGP